jgi:hypothetical protein
MFTELYLKTTNPTTQWIELFQPYWFSLWIFSVFYHILLYTGFANLVSFVFLGRLLSLAVNQRLVLSLFVIMMIGYFGRIQYVKDIYKGYEYDREKTRQHTDQFFISWIFLG